MGWAEAFSRGPKPWPPYLAFAQDPGEPDSHLGEPLGPSPRLDRQVLRWHQRLLRAEGGDCSHLEVLRFVRQRLSGCGRASLPSSPGVVGGRMGRWLLWGDGGPWARSPALVQEWLGLVSREPLVLSILLSSCVWRRGC